MLALDTNVLVYAADTSSPEHVPCRARLEACRGGSVPWYLTWAVIYEFLRVVTHPRVFRTPWTLTEAWQFIDALLASPTLTVLKETDRHAEVTREIVRTIPALRGNIVHDLHTAALMKEHGVRALCTRDTDFHRFGFLEVIDPLA
ncbi:MAG: PIN domain-containing protein [Acidobacteria bacterium]|jgi:hypothetical protein|nr:PIN domain-containing protein [Acidobacteriota bacterium]